MEELIQAYIDGDAEKVSLLVANGVPVNTPYQGYDLPIMVATVFGQTRIVEILLRNGAQVNLQNNNGFSASFEGHTETAKLDHGADVNFQPESNGFSALTALLALWNTPKQLASHIVSLPLAVPLSQGGPSVSSMDGVLTSHLLPMAVKVLLPAVKILAS